MMKFTLKKQKDLSANQNNNVIKKFNYVCLIIKQINYKNKFN